MTKWKEWKNGFNVRMWKQDLNERHGSWWSNKNMLWTINEKVTEKTKCIKMIG